MRPGSNPPDFFCLFRSEINSQSFVAQQRSMEWLATFDLLPTAQFAKKFGACQFALLPGRMYPEASGKDLQILADWTNWLFLLDDLFDESSMGTDFDRLTAYGEDLISILLGHPVSETDSLQRALVHLSERLRIRSRPAWMLHFVRNVQNYLEGCAWEARNRAEGVLPSIATFKQLRRYAGAVDHYIDFGELSLDIYLPIEVRQHSIIIRLSEITCNVLCWSNDVCSVEKEVRQGDSHNLVVLLANERSLSVRDATRLAIVECDSEIRDFMALKPTIPSFGTTADAVVSAFVGMLETMIRGSIEFTKESGRYVSQSHANPNHDQPHVAWNGHEERRATAA